MTILCTNWTGIVGVVWKYNRGPFFCNTVYNCCCCCCCCVLASLVSYVPRHYVSNSDLNEVGGFCHRFTQTARTHPPSQRYVHRPKHCQGCRLNSVFVSLASVFFKFHFTFLNDSWSVCLTLVKHLVCPTEDRRLSCMLDILSSRPSCCVATAFFSLHFISLLSRWGWTRRSTFACVYFVSHWG